MGNGQGLQISNIGSFVVHIPPFSFHLNQILHVPDIATNLLLVHQLTKDNNYSSIFDSTGFSILDQVLGRMLSRGLSKNGPYPFPTTITNSNRECSFTILGASTFEEV